MLVRDRKARDDHAVLAARDDGHWLILDNRHHALDHDTSLAHLTPLFAINHEGVKLVAAPYLKPQAMAGADAAPAPWLEGDEFALRGSVAIEPANGGGRRAELAAVLSPFAQFSHLSWPASLFPLPLWERVREH